MENHKHGHFVLPGKKSGILPLSLTSFSASSGYIFKIFKNLQKIIAGSSTDEKIRHYSEAILQYMESIDWHKEGMNVSGFSGADRHVRKVFDAVSYIKSEIDDLLSQRAAAEKVLKESEARYRQLVEHAKAAILEFDFKSNCIVSVNDSFREISGYSLEEVRLMNPMDLLTEDSKQIYTKRFSKRLAGETISPDSAYEFVAKSGKKKWVILNTHISHEDGRPVKANVVLTDITHLKEVETELISYQEKLRQLTIQLSKTEENQRRQIASRLHESVGQELFVAQLKLNALERSLNGAGDQRQIEEVRGQILKSLTEVKAITYDLSPPVLYDLGLKEAVLSLAKSFEARYRIPVKARFAGDFQPLDDEMKVIIFSVIKELMNNAMKHARADFVNILIDNTNDQLKVDIIDNGTGFDAGILDDGKYVGEGFGLFDINEKINHLGGNVNTSVQPPDPAPALASVCRWQLLKINRR